MKKKWFIVILVLVVVAIVLAIVFINLFKERDTKALTEKLVKATEDGYLTETDESNQLIDEYLTGLKSLTGEFSDAELNTISNYLEAYASFEISMQFFAKEMLFADATDTYTNNRVKIEEWIDKAQKSADALKKYILDVKSKTQGSEYWQAATWTDCKSHMNTLIKNTGNASIKLAQIYKKSVPAHVAHKGFLNNGLTDIIFDAMTEMTNKILKNTKDDAEYGHNLFVFVNAYLSESGEKMILNFPYSTDLQEKVASIKQFGKDSNIYASFIAGELMFAQGGNV